MRSGPPKDFERDLDLPVWAGVIPLRLTADPPMAAERVPRAVTIPHYARDYTRLVSGYPELSGSPEEAPH